MSAAATLVCAEPAVARIATAPGLRAGGGRRRSSTPRPAYVTQCPRNGRRSRGRDQRLPDAAVRGASPHPATFRVSRYPGTRKIGHYGGLGPRAPFVWRRRPDKGQAAHRTALLTLALSSIRGRRLGFADNFPCRASAPSRSTRRASSRCDRRSRLRRLRWGPTLMNLIIACLRVRRFGSGTSTTWGRRRSGCPVRRPGWPLT